MLLEVQAHNVVMEPYVSYSITGELFDKVIEAGSLSEKTAANIMCQLLKGVGYLHEMGIIHRDIKVVFQTLNI